MQAVATATTNQQAGVSGDHKGAKFPRRAVTLLAREDWNAALLDLAGSAGPPLLPWTARRANLLTEGIALPRAVGSILQVGTVVLEVTFPTTPCARMDEEFSGLRRALAPHWRGGVTTRVIAAGTVALGDAVDILYHAPVRVPQLPG